MSGSSEDTPYTMADLLHLMERLRDPETGCPWDVKQTYKTIAPYTLEEAYEVIDAIEREDFSHLKEELGDLLLQVVFYGQIAKEEGRFQFESVVSALVEKLLRRHPHVFPEGTLTSRIDPAGTNADQVKSNWEAQKQLERNEKGLAGQLDDVPQALPALKRAQKLQKRAAKVGFDWSEITGVLEKIQEESAELASAFAQESGAAKKHAVEEELGDLLFTLVNLSRHMGVDAEEALRKAGNKFQQRFQFVEYKMRQSNTPLAPENLSRMEEYWLLAKRDGR